MLGQDGVGQLKFAAALAAAVLALSGCSAEDLEELAEPADTGPVRGPVLPAGAHTATIERVVDGDTVELSGVGKARLIGIDTPEVYGGAECYGREASAYAKRQLEGETVSYTVGRDERDRYGRVLVYVWLADGRSFNALLVARGYAQPLTIQPNDDYADLFVRLSRLARERGAGLWGETSCYS